MIKLHYAEIVELLNVLAAINAWALATPPEADMQYTQGLLAGKTRVARLLLASPVWRRLAPYGQRGDAGV